MKQTEPYSGDIPKNPIKFLLFTLKPVRLLAVVGIVIMIATQSIAAFLPLFFSLFLDDVTATQDIDRFVWWSIVFVVINIVFYAGHRIAGWLAISIVLQQNRYAFASLKSYLLQHSHTYFIDRFAGSITSKIFHAADRSSEIFNMIYSGFFRIIINIVAAGVLVGFVSLWLLFAYVTIIIFSFYINYKLVQRRRPHVVAAANSNSLYRGKINDVSSNMQAVRLYARSDSETSFLNLQLDDAISKDRTQWRMAEINYLINNLLTAFLLIVMVGGACYMLIIGQASIGEMFAVMLVMYRLAGIMVDIGDWMNRMMKAYGEAEEGLDDILINHEIVDVANASELQTSGGTIQFTNLTFAYDSQTIFDNLNLDIKPGERIGLVGPSGAGKSTLVSLLLRQHDLTSGAILIDNQNIAEVTQDSLRSNIALVPQEPMLFHRTIAENIKYGKPDATYDEMVTAADRAQAREFIEALPEQYDTLVGERGVKLSGGQKQRVAIARAMLKEAPILVLDEATSALDSESEVAIQKALESLMENKTVIAVAHRLSTLRKMDRILVIDQGKIVEDGTHDSLANAGGLYAKLWEHQAGGFVGE